MARGTYTVGQLKADLARMPADALVFVSAPEGNSRIDDVLYDEDDDNVWIFTERL